MCERAEELKRRAKREKSLANFCLFFGAKFCFQKKKNDFSIEIRNARDRVAFVIQRASRLRAALTGRARRRIETANQTRKKFGKRLSSCGTEYIYVKNIDFTIELRNTRDHVAFVIQHARRVGTAPP